MQNILEDIELDVKELKCLVDYTSSQSLLIHVVKRRIQEIRKRLDLLEMKLDSVSEMRPEVVMAEGQEVAIAENNVKTEESVEVEETVIFQETIIVPETVAVEYEKEGLRAINNIIDSGAVVGEQLKPVVELSKSLSLNDTFRFSRELFAGDTDKMNLVLQRISKMNSLAEALNYVNSEIKVAEDNEMRKDFVEVLNKFFV